MKAVFVELPPFDRIRSEYLDEDGFLELQNALMANPATGDVMEGTGGLRKVRHTDSRRGKGKSGGLRVIYFWWEKRRQFWLFTLYDKSEADDLTPRQRAQLKDRLKAELEARGKR